MHLVRPAFAHINIRPQGIYTIARFSAAAVQPKTTQPVGNSKGEEQSDTARIYQQIANPQTAAQFYHAILHKSRGANALPKGDLLKLFKFCKSKDDVKYVVKAVDLFQKKGQDFNAVTGSLFTQTCIQCEDPLAAVEQLLEYESRIGAWQSSNSIHKLVAALQSQEKVAEAVNMLGMMVYKGVTISKETLEIAADMANKKNDPILNKRMVDIVAHALGNRGQLVMAAIAPMPKEHTGDDATTVAATPATSPALSAAASELLAKYPTMVGNQAEKTQGLVSTELNITFPQWKAETLRSRATFADKRRALEKKEQQEKYRALNKANFEKHLAAKGRK